MANKIYGAPETAIVFKASGGDVTFTPQNVAAGAGRISSVWDRGAGSKPTNHWRPYGPTAPVDSGVAIRFVASDGTVHTGVTAGGQRIDGTDIWIGCLAEDLPASITPLKFMPLDWPSKIPGIAYGFLCVYTNQLAQASVGVVMEAGHELASGYYLQFVYWPTEWLGSQRLPFVAPVVSGDSGSPVCAIINGVPTLLTCWTSVGSGPSHFNYLTEIQAAMDSLAPGHTLGQADLSGFTNY